MEGPAVLPMRPRSHPCFLSGHNPPELGAIGKFGECIGLLATAEFRLANYADHYALYCPHETFYAHLSWYLVSPAMAVRSISLMRFNILAAYTRQPSAFEVSEEVEHFATDSDRVLGTLIRDKIDDDYAGIVLGKDESSQYRCVDVLTFTNLYDSARAELIVKLEKWRLRPDRDFYQGEPKRPFLDVFLPAVSPERLNASFLQVATAESFTAARRVIERMMPFFQDVDGTFIEQFQTTAFDSRVWELYLFAALTELKVAFDRDYNAPDYLCDFYGYQFFVEATTANPTIKNGVVVEPDPASMEREHLKTYFTDYMPIKWGSALWSKLAKRYWELPHVANKPIVLAVQDFHLPNSMSFSSGTLMPYLYGRKFGALYDAEGNLVISNAERMEHAWEGKTIPSGFFKQPNAEHISAVISNPLGTISKFNRLETLSSLIYTIDRVPTGILIRSLRALTVRYCGSVWCNQARAGFADCPDASAFSLLVHTGQPTSARLFLKKRRTSLNLPVQSRSENALVPDNAVNRNSSEVIACF